MPGAVRDFLERCLAAALLAASAATLLVAARNHLAPVQEPTSFALVLWRWVLLASLAVAGPAAAAVAVLARTLKREAWLRPLLALALAALLATLLLANRRPVLLLLELDGPPRFVHLAQAGFGLALIGLVATGLAPIRRPLLFRGPTALALAATLGAFWPLADRAATGSAEASARATAPRPRSGERLLVVGVDGADWDHLEVLLARGELPHFAELRARGAWGSLQTFEPTLSPAIWTSIATGKPPRQHGVRGFTNLRLRGVDDPMPRLRPVRGLGFPWLLAALERRGVLYESAVTSRARRVPAYWTLASQAGFPVDVLNWWATWPAEPILGRIVSERTYHWPPERQGLHPDRVTYPDGLYGEIAHRIMRPNEMTLEQARLFIDITPQEFEAMRAGLLRGKRIEEELPYFFSLHETTRRLALHLLERSRAVPDLLVLYRLVDMTCHTSLQHSELVPDHLGAPDAEVERYSRVVTAAYRLMDRALGEMLAAFGEGTVIVLSDHGFELQDHFGETTYGHRRAPAGIFLAAGPSLRPGRIDGMSVYDVLPLLAYLKGLPVAADLAGRLPEAAFKPALLTARPPTRVASYGARGAGMATALEAPDVDAEMLERLRALGYIAK